jgi:AcrR family transcriptional regulator
MVSSALYRYFPSRDDLLTALITDAYDSLGQAAAAAHAAAADASPPRRWTVVCEAVRGWALAHPHEYALIYGSPVPGYTAPETTVPAAARVGLVLIGIVRDAHERGGLNPPPLLAPGLPPEAVAALVAAWAQLFGLVGFELFGQFRRVVEEREPFFRHAVARLAEEVGLRP